MGAQTLMLNSTLDDYSEWYKFVDNPNNPDDPEWCVELLKGDWKGVLYKYGQFNFYGETKKLNFGYDVLYVPDNVLKIEYPDEYETKFNDLLGEILVDIVSNYTERNLKEDINAKFGNTYIKDSDIRRVIYKESNPFLKG